MRMIVSLLAVSTLISVACRDQGPERRQQAIFQIKVTPTAAVMDTIRILFSTGGTLCDSHAKVDTEFLTDALRFTASSVPATLVCTIEGPARNPFIYIVAPPHLTPYTIRFAEPGQSDSVRVVQAP
jgi:hypothetical protein